MNKMLEDTFEQAVQEKFRTLKDRLTSSLNAAVRLPPSYDSPLGNPPGAVTGYISAIIEAMLPALRLGAEAEVTANLKEVMEGKNKLLLNRYDDPFRSLYR